MNYLLLDMFVFDFNRIYKRFDNFHVDLLNIFYFCLHIFLSCFLCSFFFLLPSFRPSFLHFLLHSFLPSFPLSFLHFFPLFFLISNLQSHLPILHHGSHEGSDLCGGTFQQEESSCRAYILCRRYLQIILILFF